MDNRTKDLWDMYVYAAHTHFVLNEDTIILHGTTNTSVWRHSSVLLSFSNDDYWLKKLSLASVLEYSLNAHVYIFFYTRSFSLYLMTMTTSSSTARRTIDVTCKPINRKKSSHFAYTRVHAKASEQGLSFLPLARIVLVTSIRNHYMLLNKWRKTATKK
jgi:hypothetical protein